MIWISLKHNGGEKYWMFLKLGEHTFRSEFALSLKEVSEAMDSIDIEETLGTPAPAGVCGV